jgi:hypothetical protein
MAFCSFENRISSPHVARVETIRKLCSLSGSRSIASVHHIPKFPGADFAGRRRKYFRIEIAKRVLSNTLKDIQSRQPRDLRSIEGLSINHGALLNSFVGI